MSVLAATYQVAFNSAILYMDYFSNWLQYRFAQLIDLKVSTMPDSFKEEVYLITIVEVPKDFKPVSDLLRMQAGGFINDPELEKSIELLQQLDPMGDPKPVKLEFNIMEIISFVKVSVQKFEVLTPDGPKNYFGIPELMWFKFYPVKLIDLMHLVDFGNSENFAAHLFDSVFAEIRATLYDLYIEFYNSEYFQNLGLVEVKTDADVQEL